MATGFAIGGGHRCRLYFISVSCLFSFVSQFTVFRVEARCSSASGLVCPRQCTCTTNNINCAGKGLIRVPVDLPANVKQLSLNNNRITSLTVEDFAECRLLLQLNVSFNLLNEIGSKTFADTKSLEFLDLSSNNLVLSRLETAIFSDLHNLTTLWLNNNSWHNDEQYHGKLISGLDQLQFLAVDGLPNTSFPKEFSSLTKLHTLFINGGINEITNETFVAFTKCPIAKLSIRTYDYLTSVEPLSFWHFERLKILHLSYNYNLGFEKVANAWFGLQNTMINFLGLISITSKNAKSSKISKDFFNFLNLTKIEALVLSDNNLEYIEPMLSTSLPHLTALSLAGNQLYNSIDLINDCAKLQHLATLKVGYQSCPMSPIHDIENLNKLNDISWAALKLLKVGDLVPDYKFWGCNTYEQKNCKPLRSRKQIESTVVSADETENVSPICIPLAPNLVTLKMPTALFIQLQSLPPLTITGGGGKLSLIRLRGNGLQSINGPITFTQSPQDLNVDLAFNQIECLHPAVLRNATMSGTKVTSLNFFGNRLGQQLEHDINGSTFQYYQFLAQMDLSYNGIKQLHPLTFHNLHKMEVLRLSGNSLKTIDFNFTHMQYLRILDISYNDVTSLSEVFMQEFSTIILRRASENKTFLLGLEGNPLQCSCETLSFLHWMSRNHENMLNFEANSCSFTGQYVNFSRLQDYILLELDFKCSKSIAVIVSGTLVGFVLFLATVSAICYRNRWEIRYAFIKLTQRGQRYQQLFEETIHYDYDAFVVYDSADRQWVNDELLPHLEQSQAATTDRGSNSSQSDLSRLEPASSNGLRFCVHERDFKPGEDIIGNVWNKMERSRKVLLVISKTFALSHYCDYEMNLARMQSVEVGRNIIVPVLLGMPDIERITDCLYWVLRKVTYIEWPQNEEERDDFWQKLHQTLVQSSPQQQVVNWSSS